jgi:hypothetical protein
MFAAQLKVGEEVIKGCFVQAEDVCSPSFVIGVAGRTFIAVSIRGFSMKAGFIDDVIVYVLVTVKAEFPLLRSAECFVARGTLRFQIGMTLHEIAWHNQGFNALCVSSVTIEASKHR